MTGFRILAVDDDPIVLDALAELLRAEGHEVETASCFDEAECSLRDRSFHLVITDLVMPGKSGLDLVRMLQKDHPGTPVLLVTGQAQLATAALGAASFDYLCKPIDPHQLRAVVTRELGAQGNSRVQNTLLAPAPLSP